MPSKLSPSAGASSLVSWPQRYGVHTGLVLAATVVLAWIGAWQLQLRIELVMAVSMAAMLACIVLLMLQQYGQRGHDASSAGAGPAHAAMAAHFLPTEGRRWSLEVLDAMDPRHFAKLCETWFCWAGFDTRSETNASGVDIWLHAPRLTGPVAIVRCRHLRDQPVGLRDMQEFFGVVSAHQSAHGTYTTTSTYTPEALEFAQECGIDAVDGRGLLRRIQTRSRRSQDALLAVAFQAAA